MFIFIPLFLCFFQPKIFFSPLKSLSGIGGTVFTSEGMGGRGPDHALFRVPLEPEEEPDLLSVSQQMSFVSAPFFPRLIPWVVAVAVTSVVLGVLTIGFMFFTWRLYKERSRRRKGEFSSTGKS